MKVSFDIRNNLFFDVAVVGGGVAGFSAAVSAARSGAKTLLVENGGFLGGTATKGLVGPFMTCLDSKGENQIIRGFFSEFVERMVADGGAISYKSCRGGDCYSGYRTAGHIGVTPFAVESFKRVSEAICIESGVELRYHNTLIGCETENRIISAIYVTDGEGIDKINAKVFIDCTGNASLAAKANAETFRGDEDGNIQTASMFFIIDGVDADALDAYMAEHTEMRERFFMDEIEAGRKDCSFPCGTLKLRIFKNPDNTWTVNMAQSDEVFNELDSAEITSVEIAQRKQIKQMIGFLKNNIPPLRNIRLVSSASDVGIRETRRMMGKHLFCLDDIVNSRRFEDRIAVCANSIDIHQKVGVAYTPYKGDKNYYIPLSCLISKDIDNLLAAGKNLSADKYAFAAVRVIPPCFAMGEAVGITAAMAAKKNIGTMNVPIKDIQDEIIARGGYLE